MEIKELCSLIEEKKDELFETLSGLIKINSENFGLYGNEKECAEYVHELCKRNGLDSEMYSPLDIEGFRDCPDYMEGRHLENRPCVSAVFKGEENTDELMLMAHLDTVEIGDVSSWDFEPLSGEIRDGKIWGRGACDDKYAIAVALFLIKLLKEQNFVPKKNLVFAAYCDEEHGGSHGAMAVVMKNKCNRIVNMDGRNVIWHCASGGGVLVYRYRCMDTVDSAERTALAMPVVIEKIRKFANNRKTELENNRFYAGTIIPDTSLRYTHCKAGNNGVDMGVGEVEFTYYTDKTKSEILAELSALEKEIDNELAPLGFKGDGFIPATRFFHYGYSEPDCKEITDFLDAAKEATGNDIMVCGSCLSDLSVILKYGSKNAFAYGCGRDFSLPGGAHQKNEYNECDKLVEFAKNIGAYILKTLG